MGLDMYLTAQKLIFGSEYSKEKEKKECRTAMRVAGLVASKIKFPSADLSLGIAYWRKANHIHAWFVREVQGGKDDCNKYKVDRGQLVNLLTLCRATLAGKNLAPLALPTSNGFFFGNTEYNEMYFSDLKETIKQLNYILRVPAFQEAGWTFYYQSSW